MERYKLKHILMIFAILNTPNISSNFKLFIVEHKTLRSKNTRITRKNHQFLVLPRLLAKRRYAKITNKSENWLTVSGLCNRRVHSRRWFRGCLALAKQEGTRSESTSRMFVPKSLVYSELLEFEFEKYYSIPFFK